MAFLLPAAVSVSGAAGLTALTTASAGAVAATAGAGGIIAVGAAGSVIAVGAPVLATAGASIGLFELGKWALQQLPGDGKQEAKAEDVKHDIAFGLLHVRADTQEISGSFAISYPDGNYEINTRLNTNLANDNATKVVVARAIGLWGVHFKVIAYDKSKVSLWQHSLDRRNFGTITFARDGLPMFERSLHYSTQFVLEYGLKTNLSENPGFVEYLGEYPNKVFGNLAPTVKAKISFIPVYEVASLDWIKPLQTAKTCAEKLLKLKKAYYTKRGLDADNPPPYYCLKNAPCWQCNDPASLKEEPRIVGYFDVGNMCGL